MIVTKLLETDLIENRRIIKVLGLGASAARTGHLIQGFGEDANPVGNWMPIYADTENRGQPIIIGFVNPEATVGLGEKKIFSTNEDGSAESCMIHLKNDGTAVIKGEGDFMVRYNELETGFNQLKADLNALVSVFNSHVHITTATIGLGGPGTIAATTTAGTESEATIADAKIEEINLPSKE